MILNNTPIQIEWFYSIEGERTKLNWYLFEHSLEYYDRIKSSPKVTHYRAQYSDKQIALYCGYYARRLKECLLNYLRGRRKSVIFYVEYVSDYYPQHDEELIVTLSRMARASFDHMWSICIACPQQCLWEHEEISLLFEEYKD